MTAMAWTPALALGIDEIDAQHQELYRRAAGLVEGMGAGDPAAVGSLFDYLGDYAAEHFAAEERLMQESQFPGFNIHRAAHVRFVRDLIALRRLHEESGASAAVVVKARTWLSEWLRSHIGIIDQGLARHMLKKSA
jgi:hemerythrin